MAPSGLWTHQSSKARSCLGAKSLEAAADEWQVPNVILKGDSVHSINFKQGDNSRNGAIDRP